MSEKNSTSEKEDTMMSSCASCGAAEGDDIQLRTCTACKSVRYCSVTCQRNHRPKHKKACKKKAAELRDEILFKQPESSHVGDCPICLLPHQLDEEKSVYHSCCSGVVCKGCEIAHANSLRNERRELTCPFCRDDPQNGDPNQKMMKRVQANDPIALSRMGIKCYLEGNYAEAFQYLKKAAEFGDATAHDRLSFMYMLGQGVEKDEKKCLYHAEEAAIRGHLDSRYRLSCYEMTKFRPEIAKKHLIIAANLGHNVSMQALKEAYKDGMVSKEEFASALRAHKAAVDAAKSPQRDEADAIEAAAENLVVW